jgi:hypothetical protein
MRAPLAFQAVTIEPLKIKVYRHRAVIGDVFVISPCRGAYPVPRLRPTRGPT